MALGAGAAAHLSRTNRRADEAHTLGRRGWQCLRTFGQNNSQNCLPAIENYICNNILDLKHVGEGLTGDMRFRLSTSIVSFSPSMCSRHSFCDGAAAGF
jgi:hypothetical protein